MTEAVQFAIVVVWQCCHPISQPPSTHRTPRTRICNIIDQVEKTPPRSARPSHRDISKLISLVKSGKLREAETAARSLIDRFPNALAIFNVLGMVQAGQGKLDDAIACYTKAINAQPDFAEAYNNMGNAYFQLGNFEQAEASYSEYARLRPDVAAAHYNLGNTRLELGQFDEGVASLLHAVELAPNFVEAYYNLGDALRLSGKFLGAVVRYRDAIKLKPDFAEAHYNLGNTLMKLEKLDEAAQSLQHAIDANPSYAAAYNNLGIVQTELGIVDDAVASFRTAIELAPKFAEAHYNLGSAYRELDRLDDAVACFHAALAIKPDYIDVRCSLVDLLETANRGDELRSAVQDAEQSCGGHPSLAVIKAILLRRQGDYAAARSILEAQPAGSSDPNFMTARLHLHGDVCDKLGDFNAAFECYRQANRHQLQAPQVKRHDGRRYLARLDARRQLFSTEWLTGWSSLKAGQGRSNPVFLVGFPRSGTTLLDTILLSHPAIAVVEEMPTVANVQQALAEMPDGDPGGLAGLGQTGFEELRDIYFTELDRHLSESERELMVVDKQPLNMAEAGLIHRLFPDAKFIEIQRHPCDSLLSCYMQNFRPNDAMVNFLALDTAAKTYDKVMALWQHYRNVLPLKVHTVRYETLVDLFADTVAGVLEFLDLEWDDGVRNYAETARRRGKVNTPSYDQVTQPLYTRARGRWECYRKHMEPVLPVLMPWVEHFGYDADSMHEPHTPGAG